MTAQIPAETLAELHVLLEAASPLPWEAVVLGSEGYELRAPKQAQPGSRIERRARVARCGYEDWQTDKANAALIAAAINALPALLDALAAETARAERAEGKVERAEAVLAEHWDWKAGRSLHAAVRHALADLARGAS